MGSADTVCASVQARLAPTWADPDTTSTEQRKAACLCFQQSGRRLRHLLQVGNGHLTSVDVDVPVGNLQHTACSLVKHGLTDRWQPAHLSARLDKGA